MTQRKRRNMHEWRKALDGFESSHMTVAKFCRQQGISVATFYHRKKKLAQMQGNPTKTAFVKIDPIRSNSSVCRIQIGKVILDCMEWPTSAWLREVVSS